MDATTKRSAGGGRPLLDSDRGECEDHPWVWKTEGRMRGCDRAMSWALIIRMRQQLILLLSN
eukprot:CAMPEP_0174897554 /NCGR_PEP_ID=MMETSP0167-20121228/14790_1 /TAXON_ID=38298 /ORGANISM="Rhodella maculata, Strain CCMP736" /LENGTH=61 /DNA_ID=CAMNT_0016137639 /DNA_START=88 /DNA_END=270 /DNA_ORIENTATION=-